MKLLKKLLKWAGITLLVLIALLILIPVLFKDQIKDLVIEEVNKSLNAELSLGDFDLTFISTFPNMTIELMDAKLQGENDFQNVTLANLKSVRAHVGFWSVVMGDQIEIDEVHVTDPVFNVKILQDGTANYDIIKPDSLKTDQELEEPSNFKLSLKQYSISNAKVTYDDLASNIYTEIANLNHEGTGDLTADIIDFETTTTMDKLSYRMDGIFYLTEVKTDARINLLMEFSENSSKFTLKENQITLNKIKFSLDGFYEILEDHDKMDLKLDASKATFKEFLSLIPAFYHSGYEGMVSSGSMSINGFVKGKLDNTNLPGWDFNLKVNNASVNYPDLPGKINNIQIDAGSIFSGGANLNDMTVDVKRFHANFSKNTIDATLSLRQLLSDPFIESKILANVDLGTLKDFIPMEKEESYNGILDADVKIKGKMSDLDKEDYEAFTARGTLEVSDFLYQSESIPDAIDVQRIMLTFSPENLTLNEMNAQMGRSDFAMNGEVDNYLGYALRDENLKGNFTLNSNYLDLDALMPASEEAADPAPENPESSAAEPLLVPGNIDFTLETDIKETSYNDITIKNVRGIVHIKDEVADLENLTMNAMGGTVGLKGKYNTQNHAKPTMDFAYSLKSIDIQELSSNFLTVEKLAPIMKYASGKISSDFNMTTDLTTSFEPILSSLTSLGNISSNSINISGFKSLEKLESVTKLSNLSSQKLQNFVTKFKVKDGKISVTPFTIKLGDISTDVSGFTTLEKQMDYNLKMNVPKDQLPQEIIKEVEALLSKANAIVQIVNISSLPDIIPVDVKMFGDVTNPNITFNMKEAIMNALGVEGNIVEHLTETIKDTVTTIVNEQIDNAKEEIEKQKQKILNDAQKEADKIIAEAKKAADLVRSEGDKQAAELIKQAGSNPIKKKIAEAAAKKIQESAEKNAKKLEDEGKKQADGIMKNAREQADKLG